MKAKFFLITTTAVAFLAASCMRPQKRKEQKSAFTDEIVIKTTPVKDQGHSPLCWEYAMLATIESERLMMGDSVNLSPDYIARLWLQDQAKDYFLTRGRHKISLRGMASMTLTLINRYGLEPFDSYLPMSDVNYNVLGRTAQQLARGAASIRQLDDRLADILDERIGYLPPSLFMYGMSYNPQQFAQSVYLPGDYEALTSFTHHPFASSFVLESPDNQFSDTYYNVPIDSLMATIVSHLRRGHAVCWEGDITEPGFDFANGVAVLEDDNKHVTQEERQREFEHYSTTDDHCMELCGLAHDAYGNLFFLAKNSWGKGNRYHGFMYMSYNYVKLKTIAVIVKKLKRP